MASNLFIVKTPLQVINAIEAISHFNLKDNILIVVHNKLKLNAKQIDNTVNLIEWSKIILLEEKGTYFDYLSVIKELKESRYKYIFFARFGSIQRLVVANTIKEKVYYFDDGTETINMYNHMLVPNKINQINTRHIARFRFLLAGLKINIRDNIHLFTYFDLKPLKNSEVVPNRLKYFRDQYLSGAKEDDNIYFLGQPLSELSLTSTETYINAIKDVILNESKNIIYIPHKGESLNSEIYNLSSNTFEIKNIEISIELYFLRNNLSPTHIISFFTTAFFTLQLFYPDIKFEYVQVDDNLLLKKKDSILECYNFVDSIGIKKYRVNND